MFTEARRGKKYLSEKGVNTLGGSEHFEEKLPANRPPHRHLLVTFSLQDTMVNQTM